MRSVRALSTLNHISWKTQSYNRTRDNYRPLFYLTIKAILEITSTFFSTTNNLNSVIVVLLVRPLVIYNTNKLQKNNPYYFNLIVFKLVF